MLTLRGVKEDVFPIPKVGLEIAANDDFVDTVVNGIVAAAKTGSIGDGKIFMPPLERCVRIRTG